MKKFWNWRDRRIRDQATNEEVTERVLFLNGTIAEESWFDDDVTPALFKQELESGSGNITVWINSPGGDCVAAAQIYNMLMDYKGDVTVKTDGIAASAASVIAMGRYEGAYESGQYAETIIRDDRLWRPRLRCRKRFTCWQK